MRKLGRRAPHAEQPPEGRRAEASTSSCEILLDAVVLAGVDEGAPQADREGAADRDLESLGTEAPDLDGQIGPDRGRGRVRREGARVEINRQQLLQGGFGARAADGD